MSSLLGSGRAASAALQVNCVMLLGSRSPVSEQLLWRTAASCKQRRCATGHQAHTVCEGLCSLKCNLRSPFAPETPYTPHAAGEGGLCALVTWRGDSARRCAQQTALFTPEP